MSSRGRRVRYAWSGEGERWTDFTVELSGIDQALKMFDPAIVDKAIQSSLIRVLSSGKSSISENIRNIYNVKKSDLDPRIFLNKSRLADNEASIEISGRSMSLSYFGAKQILRNITRSRSSQGGILTKAISKQAKARGPMPYGVQIEVFKGKPIILKKVFIAQMSRSSWHVGVYRRLFKSRLPIEEKAVVTFATMVNNKMIMPVVLQRITDRWEIEFANNLEFHSGGKI